MDDVELLEENRATIFGSLGTALSYVRTDRCDVQHVVKETRTGMESSLEETQVTRVVGQSIGDGCSRRFGLGKRSREGDKWRGDACHADGQRACRRGLETPRHIDFRCWTATHEHCKIRRVS